MSEATEVRVLVGEIEKSRAVLRRLEAYYDEYAGALPGVGKRTREQAIVVADIVVNYYTGLETIFLRISQFFENALQAEKWHQDLLSKMTLRVEGIREAVIGDGTRGLLTELLRFRHFKRYYFDFEYDWARLDFVRGRFEEARPLLRADLDRFKAFLENLA